MSIFLAICPLVEELIFCHAKQIIKTDGTFAFFGILNRENITKTTVGSPHACSQVSWVIGWVVGSERGDKKKKEKKKGSLDADIYTILCNFIIFGFKSSG